ncbi:hypothetical protein NODU109028_09185 [Nocardioides dubius]|uniref:Uncharacterized protein n=1 Tax=Nocardioides dubius TaxID=317019 RepID=A0ABN1TU86_9ACTN
MSAVEAPGLRRGWAWVAHLRDGGTTPWAEFDGDATSQGPWLPGAIQLELARQLNLAGDAPSPEVVERVLAASAPGRGLPDLELIGADSGSEFGPRPVDPAQVPLKELIRLGTGVLAEELVGVQPALPRAGRGRRARQHVEGDPLLVHRQIGGLREPRAPGGRLKVVGSSLENMLYDVWAMRSLTGSVPSWGRWVRRFSEVDRLPVGIDLATLARRWSRQHGHHQVLVSLEESPAAPAPEAVEAARQVVMALRVLVPADQLHRLREVVVNPWVFAHPGPALGVPATERPWLARNAGLMADRIVAAGYPVHGDPGMLTTTAATSAAPRPQRVLQTVVTLLREGWDQR